jgi:pimeloyl-ACP methyl ester carboxylesterase
MKRGYVDLPEGQVHYRIDGTGEAMLLVHQTPASSAEYLEMMAVLAKKYTVIAVDTLGYGMSDFPEGSPTIELYARVNRDFLAALGITKAHIFGHHTGASIATEMAAAYPELALSLGLSGCPIYSAEVRAERLRGAHSMEITEDGSYVTTLMGLIQKYNPCAAKEFRHRTLVSGLQAGTRNEDAHVAVFGYDIAARFPLLKCPVLLLTGTKDVFATLLESTAELIPNCRTAVVEDADAMILMEKPDEIAALIDGLIEG